MNYCNSISHDTVDGSADDERGALERIATGYHGHPEPVRRLAADHLVERYDCDPEEFADLEADS